MDKIIKTKECSTCNQVKSFTMFSKQTRGLYGLRSKCKTCVSSYAKKYYKTTGQEKYKAKYQPKN